MDIDLARHVVRATFASCHQVGDLLPLLKEHCPADAYAAYRRGIATAIAAIQQEVLEPVLVEHPGLKEEVDRTINRYGCYL